MRFTGNEIVSALKHAQLPGLADATQDLVNYYEGAFNDYKTQLAKQAAYVETLVGRINALLAQIPAEPGKGKDKVTRAEIITGIYQSGSAALADAVAAEFGKASSEATILQQTIVAQAAQIEALQAQTAEKAATPGEVQP